jgi:hypothetical protein
MLYAHDRILRRTRRLAALRKVGPYHVDMFPNHQDFPIRGHAHSATQECGIAVRVI